MFERLKNMSAAKDLRRLLDIELTAVHTYDHLIQAMDLPGPADQLAQFRNEHAKHVADLSRLVETLDSKGAALDAERNVAGATVTGATGGTERALRSAQELERLTHSAWSAMQKGRSAGAARALIDRCEGDEDRHLRFIEKLIEAQVWELGDRTPDARE